MISTPVLAIALPFLGGIGAPELIIILVIVLVLFGPKRLPQLGKSLGKTMKAIREGAEGKLGEDDDAAEPKQTAKQAEEKTDE
jgi:sec-independent protein translocase protein TatA